jgi:hypothetical protein
MEPIKAQIDEGKKWIARTYAHEGDVDHLDVILFVKQRWPEIDESLQDYIVDRLCGRQE